MAALTSISAGVAAIPDLLGALPNVLNMFRSEYKTTVRDFDVKDPALICSVAGTGRRQVTVFIPGFNSSKESEILSDLANLSMQAASLKVQRDALASMLPKAAQQEKPEKPEDASPEEQEK